ncbi:MAG: carboxypeptidase-like regulatory domain-containing protein, partial [Bacteroidota bacterium]
MSPALRTFILFTTIVWIGVTSIFSQSILDQKVGIHGNLPLLEVIDSLQNDFQIAYSPDKLANSEIRIKRGSTLRDLLTQLNQKKILSYSIEGNQIVIIPYVWRSYTINGILKDVETGEHIIGAAIQVVGTSLGTITNGYGYYSLTLKEGDYQLAFSHIGYKAHLLDLSLDGNTYLKVSISPLIFALDEVEVNAITSDINLAETIPSINRIYINKADGQIPYFLGEVDVIQNALLQPGIRAIGEDASGIHVRGGGIDQNLTLLDEATIYNPNHFYGLVSVFNPEAVNDIRIMKGYIPPTYGGRASSVIEVRQKEGNANKFSYSGGIGFLSARGLIEGPLKKDKSSFLLSGRQSLLNLSIDDFASTSVRRDRFRFQDINFKMNSKPNSRNTYYFSAYYGNDRNDIGLNSVRRWGNRMVNFRWNHLFTPRIFSNLSAFVSQYNYRIESEEEPGAFVGRSRITDFSIKSDISFLLNPTNEIQFGFNSILHRLSPGSREPLDPTSNST